MHHSSGCLELQEGAYQQGCLLSVPLPPFFCSKITHTMAAHMTSGALVEIAVPSGVCGEASWEELSHHAGWSINKSNSQTILWFFPQWGGRPLLSPWMEAQLWLLVDSTQGDMPFLRLSHKELCCIHLVLWDKYTEATMRGAGWDGSVSCCQGCVEAWGTIC